MDYQTFAPETLDHHDITVIISTYHSQLLLSRHKKSVNWEFQGGPIQEGETLVTAAKRILMEESGAVTFNLQPLCDFSSDDDQHLSGTCFLANIYDLGELGECDMRERRSFVSLPDHLTYPKLTNLLFHMKEEFEEH